MTIKSSEQMAVSALDTPIGELLLGASERGICLAKFIENSLNEEIASLEKKWRLKLVEEENPHLSLAKKELKEYFEGSRKYFDSSLDLIGTDFQKSVWQSLSKTSFGETTTYKNQSLKLGNLKAIRAVASANGKNPIAIVVPCHRVLGSDGKLTGYAGGLWRKQWLIEHEQKHGDSPKLTLF